MYCTCLGTTEFMYVHSKLYMLCVCVCARVCTCVCQHLYVTAPCHLHPPPSLPLSYQPWKLSPLTPMTCWTQWTCWLKCLKTSMITLCVHSLSPAFTCGLMCCCCCCCCFGSGFVLVSVYVCVCVCVCHMALFTVCLYIPYTVLCSLLPSPVHSPPLSFLPLPSPLSHVEQAESKWSIRKEALESVLPLASKPKLSQGDYNELVKTLVKVSCWSALQGVTGQCHWRRSM